MLNLEEYKSDEEISIKEIIMILIEHKRLIAITMCATLSLTMAFTLVMLWQGKVAETMVAFNDPSIAVGKNPDGSKFDMYQLMAPVVVEEALKSTGLNTKANVGSIRQLMSVESFVTEDFKAQKEFALEKEGKVLEAVPTSFVVRLKIKKLSANESTQLLNAIVHAYQKKYDREYNERVYATNYLAALDTGYDYSDVSMVLHNQVAALSKQCQLLTRLERQSGSVVAFRSVQTGLTTAEMQDQIELIEKIEVNSIDALISTYKLTKDPNRLMTYYKHVIKQLETTNAREAAQVQIGKSMLLGIENSSLIAPEINSITKMADMQDSYFNALVLKTSNELSDLSVTQKSLNQYKTELQQLATGTYALGTAAESTKSEADHLSKSAILKLEKWTLMVNNASDEIYGKIKANTVKLLTPAEVRSDVKVSLNLAIGVILGLMLGIFVAFFKNMWKQA